MLRISPGSVGLGAPVFAVGWEGAEFAGVSGATLALDATEDLSQPFPPRAIVAIKTSKTRFIRAISSFLRQPGPRLLPNPSEWRAQNGVAYRVPSTAEPPAMCLNSRPSDHSV